LKILFSTGYITHEAVSWSDSHKQWIFLPRKVSKEAFNEEEDVTKGSNVMILADENFDSIQVIILLP